MFQLFIYIGCGLIAISGIAVGAWTSPDQQRANFYTEQPSDRKIKRMVATWSLVLAVICFSISGMIYWLG
ncbi:DUF5316 family protein [Paenibacillus glycanilyticus]|uniref:Uncharacterized protein n=1 Tax=Paenibacillus glycanilyticus TaxID=126569 RepID=A0ABQ6GE16_9BACL|nr:DUF5316 family protein [Paenibacillus glycanilyticus]GLX69214.1 hypothetical protein MU1_35590 [Paenibacillus glycanilyticus]